MHPWNLNRSEKTRRKGDLFRYKYFDLDSFFITDISVFIAPVFHTKQELSKDLRSWIQSIDPIHEKWIFLENSFHGMNSIPPSKCYGDPVFIHQWQQKKYKPEDWDFAGLHKELFEFNSEIVSLPKSLKNELWLVMIDFIYDEEMNLNYKRICELDDMKLCLFFLEATLYYYVFSNDLLEYCFSRINSLKQCDFFIEKLKRVLYFRWHYTLSKLPKLPNGYPSDSSLKDTEYPNQDFFEKQLKKYSLNKSDDDLEIVLKDRLQRMELLIYPESSIWS